MSKKTIAMSDAPTSEPVAAPAPIVAPPRTPEPVVRRVDFPARKVATPPAPAPYRPIDGRLPPARVGPKAQGRRDGLTQAIEICKKVAEDCAADGVAASALGIAILTIEEALAKENA